MKNHFWAGVKASIPACLGVLPIGISVGLLAVQAGLTGWQAILMSSMLMAGSSQIMALGMITQGAAVSAIVIGTFFINLRNIVLSSSAMHRVKETTLAQRLLASFALCDVSFAVYSLSRDDSYAFLLGCNTAVYVSYILSTAFGTLMTSFLPKIVIDSFGIAFYATFLGMLIPSVKGNGRLLLLVILTGFLNWLLRLFLPASWALISSMILGAFIGVYLTDDKTGHQEDAA